MKKILLLATAALTFAGANAEVISPQEALLRAQNETGTMRIKSTVQPRLISTSFTTKGEPALYVFDYTGNEGFMILSADDAVTPLLGYSDSERWDAENLPPQLQWWLSEYAAQIEYARNNPELYSQLRKARQLTTRANDRAAIPVMMTTKWNQGDPYNFQCPREGNNKSVTGCVATAMAQVMKFWNYPEVGQGENTYKAPNISGDLYIDFSATPFDWGNMLDEYKRNEYTSANVTAVSYLMRACGFSVNMDYSASASGTQTSKVPTALRNNFGYDKEVTHKDRSSYNETEWDNLVYNDLVKTGPVIYSGSASSNNGHCFVCDGYDGNGLYHINWGWGGMSDGYYKLSALDPADLGIGGGPVTGYNYRQSAVFGVTPPIGRVSVIDLGIDNAASDSGNVSGQGYTYRINDINDISLALSVRISGGQVNSPIDIQINELDPSTQKVIGEAFSETASERLMGSSGEVVNYKHSINFKNFNASKLYSLNVYYTLKGDKTILGSMKFAASSGVEDILDNSSDLIIEGGRIAANGQATLEVYDIEGRCIGNAAGFDPSIDLGAYAKGIYIVRLSDSNGCTVSRKIRL